MALMFRLIRRLLGRSNRSAQAAVSVLDEIWQPGRAQARERLDGQHERVQPAPSPGDRLLSERRLRFRRHRD
jgi:hypothetical protein